ncbi:TPA: glycine-rich domain-containing protein, partial [Yersinia enterocolitica]
MALTLLSANNASTVLSAGISASATTLTVNTGTGGLFPSPVSGTSFFKLTLIDAATGTLTEIVHVTARTGDTMTIVRGQEGTVSRLWSANDISANMMTAGTLDLFAQSGTLGGAALLNVGTTVGTVAAGDDPRITASLLKANNLSDLTNVPAALSNLGLLGGINSSAVGRLLNVQKISSSQAYTKTPGAKFGIVEVVGGGGAGGSPAQNGSGYTSGSGGGNSGCYVRFLVDLSSVDSVSCIIGAGGTPVTQQEGGMGGNTAFGSYATVPGGNGGLLLASATSTNRIYGMSPPRGNFGSINNAVLLDYNYGGLGGDALIMSSGARAGVGGASKLGGQTFGPGNDTPGINATTYGGGGSGVVA